MEERRNNYPYTAAGSNAYPHPGMMPRQTGYGGPPQPVAYPQQSRDRAAMLVQDAQMLTQNGFKPLSKEEREEAARIAEEAGFSFEGYQVVRREFFSHKFDPTLTIKGNSIIFNNACISKLESVVYVQVLVNPTTEKLVIRPCEEGARDAIRWCIATSAAMNRIYPRSSTRKSAGGSPVVCDHRRLPGCGMWACAFPLRSETTGRAKSNTRGVKQRVMVMATPVRAPMSAPPTGILIGQDRAMPFSHTKGRL